MSWPLPSSSGYPITTQYGKRGTSWSCNEDSSGKGVHTGVDFSCPSNTKMYATIAGTIRHRQYGSAFGDRQFAISPSAGQPYEKGEVFYAHGNERLADGVEVQVGDYVGKSGARGNVTGPHLHYEFHPSSKNAWNCSVHADPGPTLGVASDNGPHVTEHVYRSKCGYDEPTNGDASSDTVKELQERLNRIKLTGGQTLAVTGKYDADTDEEVRLWQEQVCDDDPDPAGKSYLGPNQFKTMFPSTVYTLHDDGDPAVAGGSPEPPTTSSGTTLGTWLNERGFAVEDDDVPLGRESTWRKVEFLMVHHTVSPCSADESGIANYCRKGGSGTYPPLAQIMLGHTGTVWMCCQERPGQADPGRASHAGAGKGYGITNDTMNERCLGIEVQCDGTHPLHTHAAQYDSLIVLLGELTKKYGVPTDNIIGHKEWSTTGKVDPRDDMDEIRADVEGYLSGEEVPPVTETPDPPESITFPLGIEYHYSGKPSGTLTFSGTAKKLDVSPWAPKKDGITFGMLYANVDGEGEFRTSLVRDPDDGSAFQTHYAKAGDNYLLTHVWFESGEGGRKLWYQFQSMDGTTHTVTTRYMKFFTIPWDVTVVLENALKAYTAVSTQATSVYNGIKGLLKAS